MPTSLDSPWLPRQQVWAIAPLANESGVSPVDRLGITDSLVLETASVNGIDVLPLNRTLEVMLALDIGLDGIPTRAEYQQICTVLGADAILVGTIMAYDPYQPLRLGSSIQLIRPHDRNSMVAFDSRSVTMAVGGDTRNQAEALVFRDYLPIQASGIFDAENHAVLMAMEAYSEGRSTQNLARSDLGLYHLDMDDYAEFVFHQLLSRLLNEASASQSAGTAVASAGS
ncbi:MAG: hypothetical protein VX641_00670 [Planctomycetota bacterium]|nr:hypothetical protein [Planctomycetota bacterium]